MARTMTMPGWLAAISIYMSPEAYPISAPPHRVTLLCPLGLSSYTYVDPGRCQVWSRGVIAF